MPIIKSAKKKARQALKHYERNKATRSMVKTYMKKTLELSNSNPKDVNVKNIIAKAYSVIDTAAKKHILHPNNAARKKSRLARAFAKVDTIKAAHKE